MEFIEIRRPDDFHLHVRQGEPMAYWVRASARDFARALIMPNTIPPADSPERVEAYRAAILAAVREDPETAGFTPLMAFKIMPGMGAERVAGLKAAGCLAGKYYPAGATTNSSDGLSSPAAAREALLAMEELGLPLSIHAELPEYFVLDREKAFLPTIERLSRDYPKLRIVIEHLSCAESLEFLRSMPERVCATVTVHHLLYTMDETMGEGLNPHFFCKPCLKTPRDRQALQDAVLSGNPRIFFGSDSAPHALSKKEGPFSLGGPYAPGGVFSAPAALPLLAAFFEEGGMLSRLENFTSAFGAAFYGLPRNSGRLRLVKRDSRVPEEIAGALPMLAGRQLPFDVERKEGA
jgi:dihydroorotase